MLKCATLSLALVATAPAYGQDSRAARYAFVPVTNGTLRLDTRTGEVLLCAGTGATVSCKPLRADPTDQALQRLEGRIGVAERRLTALERSRAGGAGALTRVRVLAKRVAQPLVDAVRGIKQADW